MTTSAASAMAQAREMPGRRLAGLALLVGALAACSQSSALGFAAGVRQQLGPDGLEPRPLAAAARSAAPITPLMPSPAVASAAPNLGVAAAMVALAVAVTGRSARAAQQQPRTLVALHADSPFPTTPTGKRGAKRQRAGRKRPIFRGQQIAVRVYKPTNKSISWRMHVKPGDTVMVMKGKDKGKVTTVLKTYPKWNKILCLGVNFCTKHVTPKREDDVGQRVQVEAAFHSTRVMHYSEKEQVVGNLGIRYAMKPHKGTGEVIFQQERYNKATGEEIPDQEPPKWVPVNERVDAEEEE